MRKPFCIQIHSALNIIHCELHDIAAHDALQACITNNMIAADCRRRKHLIACFNILRECLRSGTHIEFTITIDTQTCPYDVDKIMEAIKVFNDMYYDCFLSKFNSKKRPEDTIYLGGGAGFVSKTIIYSLFGAEEGVEVAENVFRNTLNRDVFISHGHKNDSRYGVSPHILKCTRMNGKRFQMGMCRFIIEDK